MKDYTVIQKPSLIVIGIECRTSNAPEAAPHDIPRHWGRFANEEILNKIPNKASSEVIALYCDYESDHTQPYSFVIGCQVSSLKILPKGMVAKAIPSSSYAVFRAIGEHPKSLIDTWGKIWQQQGLKRTYIGDYEVYGDKFASEKPEVEIWIGISEDSTALK